LVALAESSWLKHTRIFLAKKSRRALYQLINGMTFDILSLAMARDMALG
jgi:hypothetical protein